MLLLFKMGVIASFLVYQTVKSWQAATLHNFLWSGRNSFQDLRYLEEVASSQSQLTAGPHWGSVTCGGSVAFRVPWRLINPNEIISFPAWQAVFDLSWGEITAPQPLICRAGTLHHAMPPVPLQKQLGPSRTAFTESGSTVCHSHGLWIRFLFCRL